MKIKLSAAIKMSQAIESLEQNGPCKIPATTRWCLAKNLAALRQHVDSFETAREGAVKQRLRPGETKLEGESALEFQAQMAELLGADVEVSLSLVAMSDLLGTDNKIPMAALADLTPIVIE